MELTIVSDSPRLGSADDAVHDVRIATEAMRDAIAEIAWHGFSTEMIANMRTHADMLTSLLPALLDALAKLP